MGKCGHAQQSKSLTAKNLTSRMLCKATCFARVLCQKPEQGGFSCYAVKSISVFLVLLALEFAKAFFTSFIHSFVFRFFIPRFPSFFYLVRFLHSLHLPPSLSFPSFRFFLHCLHFIYCASFLHSFICSFIYFPSLTQWSLISFSLIYLLVPQSAESCKQNSVANFRLSTNGWDA